MSTVYTKTPKGVRESTGKTRHLSGDLRDLLELCKGLFTVEEIAAQASPSAKEWFATSIAKLVAEGYLRDVPEAARDDSTTAPAGDDLDSLDFSKAPIVAAKKAEEEDRHRKEEERNRHAAEEKARKEAAEKARREAEEKARRDAEEKARIEAEEKPRREAAEKARREAEEKARREAEEKARIEAEERARREAEDRIRREAEEKVRREMDEKTRRKAAEKARLDEEARIRREAEEKVRREAEEKLRREAEEKIRREMEEKARRDAEEKAKREEEERIRREAEEKIRLEAEEAARRERREKARREEEERARREAEEKIRREAEEKARIEAEEKARIEAEVRARIEAEERARIEAEEKVRREAEEKARIEAEEKARIEAEERARIKAEERARREAEEQARREAEEKARRKAEEKARKEAEEKARLEQEERDRETIRERVRQRSEKRRRMILPLVLGLLLPIAAVFLVLQFMSFDGKRAEFEKTASEMFGVPVKVGSTRLGILAGPQWLMNEVTVGGEEQTAKIARVRVGMSLLGIFGAPLRFESIQLEAPRLPAAMALKLLGQAANGTQLKSGEIRASGLTFIAEQNNLPALNINANFADGRLTKLSAKGANPESGKLSLVMERDEQWRLELSAEQLNWLVGANLPLANVVLKGTLTPEALQFSEISAELPSGDLSGNGKLSWQEKWRASAKLEAKRIDAAKLAPGWFKEGSVSGNAQMYGESEKLGELFSRPLLGGNFSVSRGLLNGVDLDKALQDRGLGDQYRFESLGGEFSAEAGRIDLRELKLAAPELKASGSLSFDASHNANGRLAVETTSQSARRTVKLTVSGTLAAPRYQR